MRVRWLWVSFVSLLPVGCGDSGGSGDEGADDGTADTNDASGTGTLGDDGTGDGSGDDDGGTSDTSGGGACEDPESWLDRPTHEQVVALDGGQLCCADVLAAYEARIDTIDVDVNAMLALDDRATVMADDLDGKAGGGMSLHCAVIAVKDNIDAEGMVTTAGSLAMVDNLIATDSPVVAGLRRAGALMIGKTNLSEWANFRGDNSSSGWSSFGGQTNNGANTEYNPCGSSSGSGAAVRAGIISAAIGTETSGSVTCPASINGVVGHKPTIGLVSRTGIVPISHSHDTAGPMTKTVHDAALVLGAIAGNDPNDSATDNIPSGFDFDFVAQLDANSLAGARLGYSPGVVATFGSEEATLFNDQIASMEAAGAELVQIQMPNTGPIGAPFTTVLLTEFKVDLNAYLASHAAAGVPGTLADLIDFNNANAAEVMPHFGQELFTRAETSGGLNDPAYQQAVMDVARLAGTQGLLAALDGNTLDAIVAPTTGPAWRTNYTNGDAGGPSSAFLPAAAGYPHLTVPMGTVGGLPVGMSFIGRPFDDAAVLSLGHAYEQL